MTQTHNFGKHLARLEGTDTIFWHLDGRVSADDARTLQRLTTNLIEPEAFAFHLIELAETAKLTAETCRYFTTAEAWALSAHTLTVVWGGNPGTLAIAKMIIGSMHMVGSETAERVAFVDSEKKARELIAKKRAEAA